MFLRTTILTVMTALLTLTQSVPAQGTQVGGPITEDTTWDVDGSPYIMVAEVHVIAGVTLTIEPGVEVRTTDGTIEVHVIGCLKADGVLFTGTIPEVFAKQRGKLILDSCTFVPSATAGLIWLADQSCGLITNCTVGDIWLDPHAGAAVEGSTVHRIEVRKTCAADTNNDGMVDFLDLVQLLSTWGVCPESCLP